MSKFFRQLREEVPDPDNNPPPGKPPADPPPGDPPADPPPPTWMQSVPDDWREQLGGEDEGKLKKLGRYTDFNKFLDGSFEAHEKARQGQVAQGLPENPTDEQVKEFREANGIPVDGEYQLSLEDGVELTDADNEIMKSVLPVALASNIGTAEMSAITSAMITARNTQIDAILAQDTADQQTTDEFLRSQENWGADFSTNQQMVDNLITRMLPGDQQEAFKNARDGDGKMLMNNPAVRQMLANIERNINPMSTIPGGQENAGQTARDIVNQAKKFYNDKDMKAYDDPGFQKKYLQAIEYLQGQGEKI